jgi:hypothetical protein
MKPHATPQALVDYNTALLHQLSVLVAQHHNAQDGPYAEFLGPHVRHIIEHYEALIQPAKASRDTVPKVVNYDARERDLQVQTVARVALERIATLSAALQAMASWSPAAFAAPLELRCQGGEQGQLCFATQSSILRELAFVASHCVHHFAMVKLHALQHGKDLGPHFGKAPSTVAHETALHAARAGC